MKRIITSIVFLLTLMMGSQTAFAQEKSHTEYATEQSTALQEQFNLTDSQKTALYRAFYAKKLNYTKHIIGKENNPKTAKIKEKLDNSFNHVLKTTLGEENYKTYLKQQNN